MSTTIATSKPQLTIKQQLNSPAMLEQIARVIPKHITAERMARVATTALTRSPKLMECDQASFFKCLMDLSQWGLEPDGRRAHLIPFGRECQLIIDYKGLVELAYRSGYVRSLHADVVRQGDLFEYNLGQVIKHVPHFLRTDQAKPAEQGEIIAAYCIAQLTSDTIKTEVLSKQEIDAIRGRSKAGKSGPWVTDYSEMAKKTAFRRLSKWLPLSADIRDAMDRDDDRNDDVIVAPPMPKPSQTLDDISERFANTTSSVEEQQTETEQPLDYRPDFLDSARVGFDECDSNDAVSKWFETQSAQAQGDEEHGQLTAMAAAARKRIKGAK